MRISDWSSDVCSSDLDTHIFRVANRTGLASGRTPREIEDTLERITPSAYRRHAHHWLILHGRYICKARRPECWRCIVSDLCAFKPKTRSEEHTSELQSLMRNSYAVFCLKKKKKIK